MQKISSKGGPATGWKTKLSRGSMLVVTMIILGIMLVSTLSMALVAVQERKASMGENTSNQAYSTAETGVEKVMQLMKDNGGNNLLSIGCANGVITSTEGYTVKFKDAADEFITDCTKPIASVKSVKSIGTAGQNQRAVEVAVAQIAGGGCHSMTLGPVKTATDIMGVLTGCTGDTYLPTFEELACFISSSASNDDLVVRTHYDYAGCSPAAANYLTLNLSNGKSTAYSSGCSSAFKYRCVTYSGT